MVNDLMTATPGGATLETAATTTLDKILNPAAAALHGGLEAASSVLVLLAAGKGTRFGQAPKCIQPVRGTPLARHSIDAYRRHAPTPVVCLVGYRHDEVAAALGPDNLYVRSDQPSGGTAFAAFEAFSVPELLAANPLLILTMGDRIVTPAVYRRLSETHRAGGREADLTLLTAEYEPPKNRGKGRVVRAENGRVMRIIEQRDIDALDDAAERNGLDGLTEGNCPLYAVRAVTLHRHLRVLTNDNAQGQFYLTDIVAALHREGGDVRTITVTVADPDYDLLCSDVTRPTDLALLESVVASSDRILRLTGSDVESAARAIAADRPPVQVAALARQIEELATAAARERLGFKPDEPVALGISGGRFRIAFMHPDMGRFFGPAWQMPIGAGTPDGDEQIVVATQIAGDRQIHLFPTNPRYRENVNSVASDTSAMYPGEEISDWNTYEEFGTRMSENLLLALGYFSDEELQRRRERGQPLPPTTHWATSNMRRPFSLVGNALASLRTLRKGRLGAEVQLHLGRDGFQGLRIMTTGNVPKGGFSSSSAVTVATKNAINALFALRIPPDLLVHLACQAEYGTGVRAGSLDQATEQKGRAGQGTLISSNPRENFCVIGTYPVPADRFQVIFPYTVERDREAWKWSGGVYAESSAQTRLNTGEMRKLTGKAAEIAALLVRLPLETDFFKAVESDLVQHGILGPERRRWVADTLRQIPLLTTRAELRELLAARRAWYLSQVMESTHADAQTATQKVDATLAGLFSGWRDPRLRRTTAAGEVVEETGVPLRAIVAYLFAEVVRNFHLIHHPDDWIESVAWSQRGDRSFDIDPERLPARAAMEAELPWEQGAAGPALLERWLAHAGATPFDYQRGLDDATLAQPEAWDLRRLPGASFFRGLALIDLAEAMLQRAFGAGAVAVRVNAAGQGDFFQVHVDTRNVPAADVKEFLRRAFYRRFGLSPETEFVEIHPGGGAVGVRLGRFDALEELARRLRSAGGAPDRQE
jgi:bifunctional UDP-N-acetylglucosamine pyrophosphorylase/glucosamine-1-phosphate N-acetyltransferase